MNPRTIWLVLGIFWVNFYFLQAQVTYQISTGNGGNPQGVNTEADNITTGWTAITTAPQSANLWSANQLIPFNFQFFGQPVTQFKVSQNGIITFSVASMQLPNANTLLPTALLPPQSIACYWDEFTASGQTGGNDVVYTKIIGTAPNRQFWIKWFSFEYGNPAAPFAYFSCVLSETNNVIYIVDHHLISGNVTASVGVQLDATMGFSYGNDSLAFQIGSSVYADNSWITFSPVAPNQPDLSVTNLVSPTSSCLLTNQEQVQVRVSNQGTLPIYGFQLFYQFNGQSTINQTYNDTILPNDSRIVSFLTPIGVSIAGKYPIIVWGKTIGDMVINNDTLASSIISYRAIASYPYLQSFENITNVSDSLKITYGQEAQVFSSGWAALGGQQGIVLDGGSGINWVNPTPANVWTSNPNYFAAVYQCVNTQGINSLRIRFNLKQQYQYQTNYTNFRLTIDNQPVSSTIQPPVNGGSWTSYEFDLSPFLNGSVQQIGFESVCKYTLNYGASGIGNANLIDEVLFWQPIITQLPADTAICMGDLLTLDTGLPNIQTFWSNGMSGNSIVVLLNQDTKLIAALMDSVTGLTTYDTVNIRVYDKPFSVLPLNPIACGSFELNALNNGNFYLWSTGETTQTITVTQTGTYSVYIWNNAANCDIIDSCYVTVNPVVQVGLGADTVFCDYFPSPITLDAGNSGAIFTWNTGDYTQTIQATTPGWYWVEVYHNNCKARDSILLGYAITPQAGISGPTVGTVGNLLSFTDNSTGGVNRWYWSFGQDATPAQAQGPGSFSVQYSTNGTKIVTLIAANQSCADTATLQVEIQPTTDVYTADIADFSLSPNPANEQLNISMATQTPTSVAIYSSLGKLVWSQALTYPKTTISLKEFYIGIYYITFYDIVNQKIIHQTKFLKY